MIHSGGEDVKSTADPAFQKSTADPAFQGPIGLGGWLILPALGILVSPIVFLLHATEFAESFSVWPYLTSAEAVYLVASVVLNVTLAIIVPAILAYLFFKRSKLFPRLYIPWICAVPIFLLADAWFYSRVFAEALAASGEKSFDKETVRGINQSIGQAVLWGIYMGRSKRVQNTFVK